MRWGKFQSDVTGSDVADKGIYGPNHCDTLASRVCRLDRLQRNVRNELKQLYGRLLYHKLGAQVHQHNTVKTEQNSSKAIEGQSKPKQEGSRTSDHQCELMHAPNQVNTSTVPLGGGVFACNRTGETYRLGRTLNSLQSRDAWLPCLGTG